MTRLFLLLPGDVRARTGGTLYDRRIAEELARRGWDVTVRTLDRSFPRPGAAALEEAARALAELPDGALALCDGLAYGAMPDAVEAHGTRLRLVALVHHPLALETGLASPEVARLVAAERRALAAARHVVTTGNATARLLARDYGVPASRLSVVEPGTDATPPATGSGGPDVALLCVASVIPRKGHDLLVSALSRLQRHDWRLTCAGSLTRSRHTAAALRAAVAHAGLADRVHLLGEVDGEALERCYREADAFVLPTRLEGYGMALAEAVARGLPVITTAGGAAADTVGDAAALLVPPDDAAALAGALDALIGSPALRRQLAAGARIRARALPGWPQAAAAMARVLDGVAAA